MTNRVPLVVYTSAFEASPHDSDCAEIVGHHPNGQVRILFSNGDDYFAFPEELVEIP